MNPVNSSDALDLIHAMNQEMAKGLQTMNETNLNLQAQAEIEYNSAKVLVPLEKIRSMRAAIDKLLNDATKIDVQKKRLDPYWLGRVHSYDAALMEIDYLLEEYSYLPF